MSQTGAERLRSLRARWADPLLALVVAAAFQIEIWLVGDPELHRPAVVVLALAMSLPLAIRRRAPLLAVTLIAAAYIALLQVALVAANEYTTIVAVILIAAYAAGHHPDRIRAVAGGLIILVATCYEVLLDDPRAVAEYVFIGLIITAVWMAGFGMEQRERRAARLVGETISLRQERDSAAEGAAADERARIARELHDIISHNVSVMVLQAGAAGEVIDSDPDLAKGSLDAIQQTGRQALVELRRLLGVLGDEPSGGSRSPQPSLEQLPTLVETLRGTGLAVDVRVLGTARALPPGVDVTAYRIIQEALTNAARHAGPAEVTVSITYGDEAVEIEVLDTGQGPTVPVRTGRGLAGMKERVALHAGRIEAGPDPAGGFKVRVWLPLGGAPA
jgi:signal transduction histidine kinase